MADTSLNRRRKLSVRTKVLFASGALQEAVVTAGGIATVLFYNQLLGVSPALVERLFSSLVHLMHFQIRSLVLLQTVFAASGVVDTRSCLLQRYL